MILENLPILQLRLSDPVFCLPSLFSGYAAACRRTASNARIANLRRDSARRPANQACRANPNEVDLCFRYIVREFSNLWIARFSSKLSCECFNLFGEYWIGSHGQTQSVTARVQCGAGLARLCSRTR